MTKCYWDKGELEKVEGISKIHVQLSQAESAIVEIKNALFCPECKTHYMDGDQLVEAFMQIDNLTTGREAKNLAQGYYN